jgi:CTP:molybdopterin cytidylyltransferase MocA
MSAIDTVILAAGSGTRLAGRVPTGLKPLIPLNGQPLISRLVGQAMTVGGLISVVVSPTNAGPIVEVVEAMRAPRLRYTVQPAPLGPGDALLLGLERCTAERVLVLAGDNWLPDGTLGRMMMQASELVVGVAATHSRDIAARFTRFARTEDGTGLLSEEGPNVMFAPPWLLWCGPLLAPRRAMRDAVDLGVPASGEHLIGPHIGKMADEAVSYCLLPCDAQDIGTPEALP